MDLLNLAEQVVLWWMCYSCIGWVWETGLNLVLKHKWVDRGALNGPICPIYGNGALLVILLLHDVTNPVALFLGSGVIACTLEYVVSWQYERLFRIRLWDYTDKPFNINGRVYLNGFLAFGAGATLIKLVVQPGLAHLTAAMPQPWLHIAAWGLLAVAFVDWLISTMGMADMDNRLARLGDDVKAGRSTRRIAIWPRRMCVWNSVSRRRSVPRGIVLTRPATASTIRFLIFGRLGARARSRRWIGLPGNMCAVR